MDFKITKCLASIFTPGHTIDNSVKYFNIIDELLSSKVGHNPQSLPIPKDAPPEIPRIIVSSEDKMWSIHISLRRTDLTLSVPDFFKYDNLDFNDFISVAQAFFSSYKDSLNLRVQRLALVTERIRELDDPSMVIKDRYCKERLSEEGQPFHNSERFEIHCLKKYSVSDYHLNSWVRIRALKYVHKATGETRPLIHLENDLNTLSEEDDEERSFNSDQIAGFFESMPTELNTILSKYAL